MTVYLVGAGPGAADLLTVRASRLLQRADVVVHDALVDDAVLSLARPGAELIDVGKRPGAAVAQETINALLVVLGADPETVVVRLKGGDPLVFGRGGEEAYALAQAGIACEIVPGVSSAFAAPAAAGIPVTHRGVSAAVTVVTGHRRDGEIPVNWSSLAGIDSTIVVLMGMSERKTIMDGLRLGGLAADTPVAIVQLATRADQHVWRGRLNELHLLPGKAPATIVIGAVAAMDLSAIDLSAVDLSATVPADIRSADANVEKGQRADQIAWLTAFSKSS